MPVTDARTAKVLITVLLFALGLGFLYAARETLIAFLFAIFFAYLMSPLVNSLEKLLHGRALAIAVIYLLLLGLLVLFFVSMGPRIARESSRLSQSLPALAQLSSGQIAEQLGEEHGWNSRIVEIVRLYLVSHSAEIARLAQKIGLRVADVAKQAWLLFVVPLLSIFFLKDGQQFSEILLDLVRSRPQRELLQGVLSDLNQMLAHFIRAQLTLAALTFVMYSAVLGHDAYALRSGPGNVGRPARIYPRHRAAGGCGDNCGSGAVAQFSALDWAGGFPRHLAADSGLRDIAAHHGAQHGTASAGGDFWSDGGRRSGGDSGDLSIDPGDGKFADRIPAMAALCGKEKVWAAE